MAAALRGRVRISCAYRKCSDQTLTLPTWRHAEAFMDEHVREVAHPRHWSVTFRITSTSALSEAVTVAYREPVKVIS